MAEATLKMLLVGEDRSAGRTLKGVGNDADRAGSKFAKMGHLGKMGALAIGSGLTIAAVAAVKFTKNAMADEQAARRLAIALHNTTGATKEQVAAVEDWITVQGKQLGVTDDELRPALNRLVTATHDVGKAQKLASLAMDVSAGTGKSLEVVSMALAKAQNGNVASLGRLGLKVKDADGKTKSLDQVTKDLAKTYQGQASAAANSAEGKFGRLKLMFDETAESIGYKLIPIASALATVLLDKTGPATEDLGNWLSDGLGPAVTDIGNWIQSDLLPALSQLTGWVTNEVVPAVKELAEKWLTAVGKAFADVKGHLGSLEPFIRLVVAAFRGLWSIIKNVLLPVLGALYSTVIPLVGKALIAIIEILGAVGRAGIWMWNNALQPVFVFLVRAIALAFEWVAKLLGALGRVPGFGWAKKLAGDLENAADKARAVADGINKIPNKKNVKINLTVGTSVTGPINDLIIGMNGRTAGHNAVGTGFHAGGATWVGERGPEIVELPRGSRVYTAAESAAAAAGGASAGGDLGTITVIVQTDSGEIIEKKLAKVKQTSGRKRLEFEAVS